MASSLVLNGGASASAQSSEPPDSPLVSTLAGSGGLGATDGPGSTATFVSPTGLSFGRDGTLYVADRNAQRIRSVSPDGYVRTIAGSAPFVPLGIGAPGGFADGPANQAKFNMPSAVLAMDDGSVLVADTNNYCIRRIRNGVVSVFAGDRSRGSRDGSGKNAQFSLPVALAKDGAGNVYVADPPTGIRTIDPSNRVTTIHFPDAGKIIALAAPPDEKSTLLVATVNRIQRLNLKTLALDRPFPLQLAFDSGGPPGEAIIHEGFANFGPVSALAAFGSADFVFTDAYASAVRFGQTELARPMTFDYSRVLTSVPPEDATLGTAAAFRDGPGPQALVNQPTGIAISPAGIVAVADTGNRRIRLLSAFNHHTHLEAHELGTELPAKPDPHEYRIAIVGNSYVWWNQSWHHSIAGMTQDRLVNQLGEGRRPVVLPIMREGIYSLASLDLIENELSEGVVDMVVLDLSTYGQMGGDGYAGPAFPSGWETTLTAALARTQQTLNAAGVAFLVINFPGATDLPGELEYAHLYKAPEETVYADDALSVQTYHDQIAKTLADANVPTLDLWPPFLQAYGEPIRTPLFTTWDHHLSPAGLKLVADQLAARILDMKPWLSPKQSNTSK